MPGVELIINACDDHAGIARLGEGDIAGRGLRCALHALGGQRHRVLVPGNRGRSSGRPRGFPAGPNASMTDSRAEAVWGQVATHAAAYGRRVSLADVCAVAVKSAQLAGGWLAAARGSDPDFVMSGPIGNLFKLPRASTDARLPQDPVIITGAGGGHQEPAGVIGRDRDATGRSG